MENIRLSDPAGDNGDSLPYTSLLPVVVARWSRLRSLTAAPIANGIGAALKNCLHRHRPVQDLISYLAAVASVEVSTATPTPIVLDRATFCKN